MYNGRSQSTSPFFMSENYSTRNLYLTDYLLAKGIVLHQVQYLNHNKCIFHFKKSSRITDLVEEYLLGKGNVTPLHFVNCVQQVKDIIHSV
mgnify:CR=1 FL=1